MSKETVSQPRGIFFCANGNVAVCDIDGEQIPKYQGSQAKSLAALKADGIDWHSIPEQYGHPADYDPPGRRRRPL